MSQKPFPIPPFPSLQLKAVLNYIEALESFDFDELSRLTTPYFTQQSLPASLGQPVRSKAEDLAFLEEFKKKVNGANLDIVIYDIVEGVNKIWVHVFITTIKIEAIYKFNLGTGLDSTLITRCIEFVDSKVFDEEEGSISGGSSDYSSDGSSDA